MTHVLITGGSGLIGSALAADLAEDGHRVTILSRSPDEHKGRLSKNVTFVGWDGKSTTGWGHTIEEVDAVVNLAGTSIAGRNFLEYITKRWTPARKQLILNSRVNAGRALTEAMEQATHKPQVLVQASAVGYYGSRGDEDLTEDSSPGEDFTAYVCVQWEESTADVERQNVRRVIIRSPGVVLSLVGGAFPSIALPFRLFTGGPIGRGDQWFSWIHILDEVRAIRFLMDNPRTSGVYNLVAPQKTTNAEFSRTLARVMRRPYWLPLPAFFFKLLFGEKAEVLLASQRQISDRLIAAGFTYLFPTAQEALENLFGKNVR